MTEPIADATTAVAVALLTHYSFDLEDLTANNLVAWWAKTYPADWIRMAVIEALYQGRYKAVSVDQILAFWLRRQQPLCHFNHEFERIVCSKFPQALTGRSIESLDDDLEGAQSVRSPLPSWSQIFESVATTGLSSGAANTSEAIPPLSFPKPKKALASSKMRSHSEADQEPQATDLSTETLEPEPAKAIASASSQRTYPATSEERPEVMPPTDVSQPKSQANQQQTEAQPTQPLLPKSKPYNSGNAKRLPEEQPNWDLAIAEDKLEPNLESAEPLLQPNTLNAPDAVLNQFADQAALQTDLSLEPIVFTDAGEPVSKQPIHQFVPEPENSGFYSKLKSVAEAKQPD